MRKLTPLVPVELADDLEDLLDDDRREAHRRLVEENEDGLGHQRAADRHHLLLAARGEPGAGLAAFLKPREPGVDPLELVSDFPAARACGRSRR